MATPVVTDDSYTTELDTALIVGKSTTFTEQGSSASNDVQGFNPVESFIQTGSAGLVSSVGNASTAVFGSIAFGSGASSGVSGNAGSVSQNLTALEADWQSRIDQPGVSWYHDFRSVGEVDAFRWSTGFSGGNNPDDLEGPAGEGRALNTVELDISDGITGGGCLRISSPQGTSEGQVWWRQFSPLKGSATAADGRGSGKVEDDPGADGALTALDWEPVAGATQAWDDGFYGNSDYHGEGFGTFDGTEFYLQMRIKNDAKHLTDQPSNGGKILFFERAGVSLDERQIVVEAYDPEDGQNLFSMNRSGGTGIENDQLTLSNQPGSDFQVGGLCDFSATGAANCWPWSNGWDTYLFHMRPGLNTSEKPQGDDSGDMVLRVWSALAGQTKYTKVWEMDSVGVGFPAGDAKGYNSFRPTCYLNKIDITDEIEHKFDQIVFSKDPVIMPQLAPTVLEERTRALADGGFFNSNEGSPVIPNSPKDPAVDFTFQNRTGFYDPIRRRVHWVAEHYEGGTEIWEHRYLDEVTNTWVDVDVSALPLGPSHWRGGCFDENTGRFFWQREAQSNVYWYDPDTDAWAFHSEEADLINSLASQAWTTGFHPNLFGSGKPGLVHYNVRLWHAFEFTDYYNDPTAGSWIQLNASYGTGHALYDQGESGQATYLPGRDEVICTGRGDRGTVNNEITALAAGAGLLAPNVDVGNGVSVRTSAARTISGEGSGRRMFACPLPGHRDGIIAMNDDNGFWQYSTDGCQTWNTGSGTCPFPAELDNAGGMSVTSLPYHGVVMGITEQASDCKMTFWRPTI